MGGLLVVIPLFIVYLLIAEVVRFVTSMVQPVAEMLPWEAKLSAIGESLLSLVILIALCFATGLAMRTRVGAGTGAWLENRVLHRLPGYRLARTLTRQFAGTEADSRFAPAVLKIGADSLTFAYIIEEHDTGYSTVLIPGAPVGTVGSLQYVPNERVQRQSVPLGRVFNCITSYGIGSGPLFAPYIPKVTGTQAEKRA